MLGKLELQILYLGKLSFQDLSVLSRFTMYLQQQGGGPE